MSCKHDYQIIEYGTTDCATKCSKCGKTSLLVGGGSDPEKIFAGIMLSAILIGILLSFCTLIFGWPKP